jgi:hypothetical protein
MTIIPVYDENGIEKYSIEIYDNINFIDGRVSKGEKYYYKGVGVSYSGHWIDVDNIDISKYDIKHKSKVFYGGFFANKKIFKNKFGIFQEKYQLQFADYIGTCGSKELSIIENSELFLKSSVDLIKSVMHDKENSQYYFKIIYKCHRVKYLDNGNPNDLIELIDYMVQNDWNFNWDKKSITDISYNGLVTDVADIFYSKDIVYKIGTVYSILYSLMQLNFKKYIELIKAYGFKDFNHSSSVFNIIKILKRNGIDTTYITPYDNEIDNYKNIVIKYIIQGKNCGHCSYIDLGEKIKQQYIENITKRLEDK